MRKRRMVSSELRRCKLLNTEWINNKVLFYSTGNYIQYHMIDNDGKDIFKKEYARYISQMFNDQFIYFEEFIGQEFCFVLFWRLTSVLP